MFNAEKYIAECLDSLLAQTLQNIEVILVNDCSTDSSRKIAESYLEKFGGRLKLFHTRKNSGYGGVPRNIGLEFSRGEYIFFCDSDDSVTPTALEELYTLAKKFDADVIHCEKYYNIPDKFWNDAAYRKQLKPYSYLNREKVLVTAPLIWENNFEERIAYLTQKKLIWNIWNQLIRRDFIIDNRIRLCSIFAEDMIFTMCSLCSAKKYVVVPNIIYNYRVRDGSLTNDKVTLDSVMHKWLHALKLGIACLDEFFGEREFFAKRLDLKYILLDMFVQETLGGLGGIYAQIPAPALDEIIRKEFSGGDNLALTSFIFSLANIQRLQLMQNRHQFNQFAAQAQKRIAELEARLQTK